MNYTKEQIEKMADEYANQFMDGRDHFYGFKAGFEKALSLFAVSGRSEQLKGDEHKSAEWRSKNLGYGSKGEMVYIK